MTGPYPLARPPSASRTSHQPQITQGRLPSALTLDLPVAEFNALLGTLHAQMVDGIRVEPGLTVEQGDVVMIEATCHSPLKNGAIYDNRYVFVFRFDGDLLEQVREYSDSAHVLATFELS